MKHQDRPMLGIGLALSIAALLPGCAVFRGERPEAKASAGPAEKSDVVETAEKAGEIATQPVRDLGIDKVEIPPVLARATQQPYGVVGLQGCKEIAAEIAALNEALGPDYTTADDDKENRAGKLAEAGGKAVVNSLIPFRGIVRELTGAAAAKRRLDDAVDAGYARRGFLRGLQTSRGCRRTA